MNDRNSQLSIVVMTKYPQVGLTKTRLTNDGQIDKSTALEIAWVMLSCTIDRMSQLGPMTLAVTPDNCCEKLIGGLAARGTHLNCTVLNQGGGDLGTRLNNVWQQAGVDRNICFLGTDCPDVPQHLVSGINQLLLDNDVVVGPTSDGGYWVLALSCYCPEVIRGIDWGTDRVYDQTCQKAEEAGLKLYSLPEWHDVDRPADVEALYMRLEQQLTNVEDEPDRSALKRLYERLTELCYAESL